MRIYARGGEDMSGREKTTQQKDALREFQKQDTETREKQRALDHNKQNKVFEVEDPKRQVFLGDNALEQWRRRKEILQEKERERKADEEASVLEEDADPERVERIRKSIEQREPADSARARKPNRGDRAQSFMKKVTEWSHRTLPPTPKVFSARAAAAEIRKARAAAAAVVQAMKRRTKPPTVETGEELPGAHALARMRGLLDAI
jgi:hypothetical protein